MKITTQTIKKVGEKGMTFAKLQKAFAQVRKAHVKTGVLGNGAPRPDGHLSNAELASIHEYGLGNVPARPWIGPPFRAKREVYFKFLSDAYQKALKDGKPAEVEKALALLGQKMVADIKRYVTEGEGVPPPLKPKTIARKKSSRPLVDSSEMLNSVNYKVEGGAGGHHE